MNDRLLRLSSSVVSRNCLSRPQLRSGRMEASDVRESRAPRGRTRPGRQHPPLEVATGHYQVYVGASSQDVRCRATLMLRTLQSREA